jgi:CMP-N-acetylneuraminic acid synthetase
MPPKPLCIIPARGGSKRLPGKNLALLAGKPLLVYAIEAAAQSGVFDRVCVTSDDDAVLEQARKSGADLALRRPPELATDSAQVRHVCKHLLEELAAQGCAYSEFGVLLTTNPLRTAQDIRSAYELFTPEAHFVMSLVPFSHPPLRAVWAPEGFVVPYFGTQNMKPTQQLPALYRHDGSIILARTNVFLSLGEFYGSRVVPYYIPPERSVDIDSSLDLEWAEFLLSRLARR